MAVPHWSFYDTHQEVDLLLQYLNADGIREKALGAELRKYYDNIILTLPYLDKHEKDEKTMHQKMHDESKPDKCTRPNQSRGNTGEDKSPERIEEESGKIHLEDRSTRKPSEETEPPRLVGLQEVMNRDHLSLLVLFNFIFCI